jgi:hypothetical protein
MSMLADTKTTTQSRLDAATSQYDVAWIGKADSMLSLMKVQDDFNSAHWIGGMTPGEIFDYAIVTPIAGTAQGVLNVINGVCALKVGTTHAAASSGRVFQRVSRWSLA